MSGVLKLEVWRAFEFYKSFLHWYCSWYKPTYLEIGCAAGDLCASLPTVRSVGVDVNAHPDWATYSGRHSHVTYYQMTSDEYFAGHSDRFGLIFIDGDHDAEQVQKDVLSSLARLQDGGLVVMHDTLPPTFADTAAQYCGTAYKVACDLRQRHDLEVYTFPVTLGLTLVGKIGSEFPWK